ncbi:hypothetical protein GCM10010435_00660 [Winogradskya consettensis]|uniref:Uncharacterized protein n=1 Tax=Winogradskya consettensis TaxID=113560 RepID=A0A919S8B4_9ACTN|nr:HAD domain-containing protein [Actinoplanes consettensis]GIM66505.1 hypothetical protein Aco04nite_02290 [Actinoplanes consettensis]
MSAEAVLLLDVDGVVNAFRAGWYAAPRIVQVYSTADAYDYRIRYEPALIDWLRRLHESGRAEVTWCSTWCSDAAALGDALGLRGLPRAFTEPVTGEEASLAKFTAAQDVITSGRRLVWVDDVEVHTYAGKCAPWTATGRALLVGPNPSRGLRTRDLRRIESFLSYPQGLP